MQTKAALTIFNKSLNDTVSRDLAKVANKYLERFNREQLESEVKRNSSNIELPFVVKLKQKIAKVAESSVDDSIPVVGRFDIYSAIKRLAERASNDRGLKRLASQLEKSWRDDMSGSMTYGQLRSLVAVYKDLFPKSKAVTALQSECARLGYHKLPVAKLTRIASKINSQHDYDVAIEVNGYDGDRPDQIKSREFIRAMVERRVKLANKPDTVTDNVPAHTAVMDKLAQIDDDFNDDFVADLLGPEVSGLDSSVDTISMAMNLARKLEKMLDSASADMYTEGLETDGNVLAELSKQLSEWIAELERANKDMTYMYGDAGSNEMKDEFVPEEPAKSVPLSQRKKLKTKSPSERADEQLLEDAGLSKSLLNPATWSYDDLNRDEEEEKLLEDAGMKKKWWDPRTWSLGKMGALLDALERAAEVVPDKRYYRVLEKFAQLLPDPSELDLQDEGSSPSTNMEMAVSPDTKLSEPSPADDISLDMNAEPLPGMGVEPDGDPSNDLGEVVDFLDQVNEFAEKEAPIGVQDYVQHEQSEGVHSAPIFSPTWGAEEILLENHTAAPPSDEWMNEELEELDEDMKMSAAKSKAPSLKMPAKKSKAKKPGLSTADAAKVLRADKIEAMLLSGRKLVAGNLKMFVNDNDEVELWRGDVGRATDMMHLDTAIADFIKMAQMEISPPVIDDIGDDNQIGMPDSMSSSDDAPSMDGAAVPDAMIPAADMEVQEGQQLPMEEVIRAALMNYKAQGMNLLEGMKEFLKEHGERVKDDWTPSDDAMLLSVAEELWTGSGQAPDVALMTAKMAAGMKVPKVRVPSDKVKVKGLGKDTEQDDSVPTPSKVNEYVKPRGKMSDTGLGKDTEGNDIKVPSGKPSPNPNVQRGKPGVSLSNTDLGRHSDQNEPFKSVKPGSKPTVKRSNKRVAQINYDINPISPDELRRTLYIGKNAELIISTVKNRSGGGFTTNVWSTDESGSVNKEIITFVNSPNQHAALIAHDKLVDNAMRGMYVGEVFDVFEDEIEDFPTDQLVTSNEPIVPGTVKTPTKNYEKVKRVQDDVEKMLGGGGPKK